MPRVSVVVPIYNVAEHLPACLRSIAAQTHGDLEVVMVDDGSTDDSAAIARDVAATDARFRLISQPNGGLGHARNTGTAAATGEYLAFADSDDVVPPDAYANLLAALAETGSDFASGNVHRLTDEGASQAPFLARTFARTRLRTHVTEFQPALGDRTAWNKLFRRAFWDEHALRFPEGVLHEDIAVMLRAHARARSVDLLAEPVYLWRVREGSITQRRLEPRALVDRLAAIEHVRADLAAHAPARVARWYDERLVADDLKLHLDVLGEASEAYRALFLERAGALTAAFPAGAFDALPAIDRLKWHLARRGLTDELLEVLRFQREELPRTPPLRIRGRWVGDYPFRTDAGLGVPAHVYRLARRDTAFALRAHLEALEVAGGALRIRGYAYLDGIGAPTARAQRVAFIAARPGRLERLRLRTTAKRLPTRGLHRPDLEDRALAWAGFEATLDPAALRRDGAYELCAKVRAGGVRRRYARFAIAADQPIGTVDLPTSARGVLVQAKPTSSGRIRVEVFREWLAVDGHRLLDGQSLELTGAGRLPCDGPAVLEVRRSTDGHRLAYDLDCDGTRFSARLSLADLGPAEDGAWELHALAGDHRVPLTLPEALAGAAWRAEAVQLALRRTLDGGAAFVASDLRPVVDEVRWTADGALELGGAQPGEVAWDELVLVGRRDHVVPMASEGAGGRFAARLAPAHLRSLSRDVATDGGSWRLHGRRSTERGRTVLAPARLAAGLGDRRAMPGMLALARDGGAVLALHGVAQSV